MFLFHRSIYDNLVRVYLLAEPIYDNPVRVYLLAEQIYDSPVGVYLLAEPIYDNPVRVYLLAKPIYDNPVRVYLLAEPVDGPLPLALSLLEVVLHEGALVDEVNEELDTPVRPPAVLRVVQPDHRCKIQASVGLWECMCF